MDGMTHGHYAVLSLLTLHCDRHGYCFPSQGKLAELLKASRQWVNQKIKDLVDLGVIEQVHRTRQYDGGKTSCQYRVKPINGYFDLRDTAPEEDVCATDTLIPATEDPMSDFRTSLDPVQTRTSAEHVSENETACAHGTATLSVSMSENLTSPVADMDTKVRQIKINSLSTGAADPKSWYPETEDLEWAASQADRQFAEKHAERFRLKVQAKGYSYQDLTAAWKQWFLEDFKVSGRTNDYPESKREKHAKRPVKEDALSLAMQAAIKKLSSERNQQCRQHPTPRLN